MVNDSSITSLGLAEKEGVKATSMLVKGRPFEQIVNITKSFDIDLVVMGTYGRRGARAHLNRQRR